DDVAAQGALEARVDQVHLVDLARLHAREDRAARLLGESPVGDTAQVRLGDENRGAAPAEVIEALLAEEDQPRGLGLLSHAYLGGPDQVRVEGSTETPVGGDEQDRAVFHVALRERRVRS